MSKSISFLGLSSALFLSVSGPVLAEQCDNGTKIGNKHCQPASVVPAASLPVVPPASGVPAALLPVVLPAESLSVVLPSGPLSIVLPAAPPPFVQPAAPWTDIDAAALVPEIHAAAGGTALAILLASLTLARARRRT